MNWTVCIFIRRDFFIFNFIPIIIFIFMFIMWVFDSEVDSLYFIRRSWTPSLSLPLSLSKYFSCGCLSLYFHQESHLYLHFFISIFMLIMWMLDNKLDSLNFHQEILSSHLSLSLYLYDSLFSSGEPSLSLYLSLCC